MNKARFILKRLSEEDVKKSSNFWSNLLTAIVMVILSIAQAFGIDTSEVDPTQIGVIMTQLVVFLGNVYNILTHLLNPKPEIPEPTKPI